MDKELFITEYLDNKDFDRKFIDNYCVVLECNCKGSNCDDCKGWVISSKDPQSIKRHKENYQ